MNNFFYDDLTPEQEQELIRLTQIAEEQYYGRPQASHQEALQVIYYFIHRELNECKSTCRKN